MSPEDHSIVPHRERSPAVLVTGGSSGIGRAIALHLADQGFTVFATVRRPDQAEELTALGLDDLIPLHPLDLTEPDHVPGVVAAVADELQRRGLPGLYALVNNAGGGQMAPVELMDPDGFQTELITRLVGPLRLVQAFLPSIRRAKGRLIWIATPSLIPIPHVASIHAADFAVNCLARTLQLELKPWGIHNVLVRCGGIETPSPGRTHLELDRDLERWSADRADLYRDALMSQREELYEFDRKRTDPLEVGKVVCRALRATRPRGRYLVGHMARAAALLELFPQGAVDRIMASR